MFAKKGLAKQGRLSSDCFVRINQMFAILTRRLRNTALITNILFENRKNKVFEILEDLPNDKIVL